MQSGVVFVFVCVCVWVVFGSDGVGSLSCVCWCIVLMYCGIPQRIAAICSHSSKFGMSLYSSLRSSSKTVIINWDVVYACL